MYFLKRRQGAKSANRRQERKIVLFASGQLVASSRRYGCSFVTADLGRQLMPCATPNQKSLGELGVVDAPCDARRRSKRSVRPERGAHREARGASGRRARAAPTRRSHGGCECANARMRIWGIPRKSLRCTHEVQRNLFPREAPVERASDRRKRRHRAPLPFLFNSEIGPMLSPRAGAL